jgi:hypothetical protein
MIILTGTKDSAARPASPAARPAAAPEEAKLLHAIPAKGNFWLDGIELAPLTAEESKALSKTVKKVVSAVSPEVKGAVKALDAWLSAQEMVAAFRVKDGSWFAVIDAGIDAAGDLADVMKLILPAIADNRVFRIADDTLTLTKEASKIYKDATAKDPPR